MITIDGDARLDLDDLPLRSRHSYALRVDAEADWVPVHVLVGVRRRPCLGLAAGVHGNEYEGMVTLAELLAPLDPQTLDGSLIVVPIANLAGPNDPDAARRAPSVWHLRGVEAETDGLFRRAVELHESVEPGAILGRLIDVRNGGGRDVRSPVAAVVGGYRVHAGVRAGDRLVTLWERAG